MALASESIKRAPHRSIRRALRRREGLFIRHRVGESIFKLPGEEAGHDSASVKVGVEPGVDRPTLHQETSGRH